MRTLNQFELPYHLFFFTIAVIALSFPERPFLVVSLFFLLAAVRTNYHAFLIRKLKAESKTVPEGTFRYKSMAPVRRNKILAFISAFLPVFGWISYNPQSFWVGLVLVLVIILSDVIFPEPMTDSSSLLVDTEAVLNYEHGFLSRKTKFDDIESVKIEPHRLTLYRHWGHDRIYFDRFENGRELRELLLQKIEALEIRQT